MALNREQILSKKTLPREKVHVPEWDGDVWVRTLPAWERNRFEISCQESRGKRLGANLVNVYARLAVLTLCDETGKRLFQDEDAAALGELSAAALDRIFEVASRLNRLSKEDVEDLVKNSEHLPNGSSSSALLVT